MTHNASPDLELRDRVISPVFVSSWPSAFGELGIVWRRVSGDAQVVRIVLPDERRSVDDRMAGLNADGRPGLCAPVRALGERLQHFLAGEEVTFSLELLALERCSVFQRRVLLAEHAVPRGWVSTYGRIARTLDRPGGARAVGRALATNPFPLVIPCHRAIRANGELGGYQGGVKMKRALLEFEWSASRATEGCGWTVCSTDGRPLPWQD